MTKDDLLLIEKNTLNAISSGYDRADVSLYDMVETGGSFSDCFTFKGIDSLTAHDLNLANEAIDRVFFLYTQAKTYVVGGAVRDNLMGLTPKDRDFCVVGATPEEMLYHGFSKVGAAFPVFLHPVSGDEYALARREKKTGNGYHGFVVEFGTCVTIEEDLKRRDLTMNAIAYDHMGARFIDPFNGQADIDNKVIRMVNAVTFAEDPLRVLRALRFAARYKGFTIDPKTHHVMSQTAPDLKHLSNERFYAELVKLYEEVGLDAESLDVFWVDVANFKLHKHVPFFKGFDGNAISRMSERYTTLLKLSNEINDHLTPMDVLNVSMLSVSVKDMSTGALKFFADVKLIGNAINMIEDAPLQNSDTSSLVNIIAKAYLQLNIQHRDGAHIARLGDLCNIADGSSHFRFLRELGEKWSNVRADQFPELTGRALGDAIFAARAEILYEIITGE